MTPSSLHETQATRSSARLEGLVGYGNEPESGPERLRSDASAGFADYIKAVRDKERLPPHAFTAGFFTELADRSGPRRGRWHARATPIAPIRQAEIVPSGEGGERPVRSSARRLDELRPETAPDRGRRVQLWWDELAAGAAPLRADEVVRFVRLGEWLGRVDHIGADRFAATLWDRAHPGTTEYAEFYLEQVSHEDRARLTERSFFYWTIGYTENVAGERTSASRVRLRRVRPTMPPELAAEAGRRADVLLDALGLPPTPGAQPRPGSEPEAGGAA